jgi:2-polyprenyl-6-hydroxyphenyl methylase / 3-demethylubiquinone-9 3-methyltransferase
VASFAALRFASDDTLRSALALGVAERLRMDDATSQISVFHDSGVRCLSNYLLELFMRKQNRDVNNELYHQLGERWYTAQDDPVALLRAESRLRNPWVREVLRKKSGPEPLKILDVGCGGGFLSNFLAQVGHKVTGVDLSEESLAVARQYDSTQNVSYLRRDARSLEFPDASFDVVCAMDFLEHVDSPGEVIRECARTLKPGGLFFFHTFNRNWISYLIAIRGVEWVVKNVPQDLHVYPLFIKPMELVQYCSDAGLRLAEIKGMRPQIVSKAFLSMLLTGRVSDDFKFEFTSSLLMGYSGFAVREIG